MNVLTQVMETPVAHAIAWSLVHLVWQGAAVALVLALLLRMLRQQSAAARYVVSCAAMLMIVILPLLSVARSYGMGTAEWTLKAPLAVPSEAPLWAPTTALSLSGSTSWSERAEAFGIAFSLAGMGNRSPFALSQASARVGRDEASDPDRQQGND